MWHTLARIKGQRCASLHLTGLFSNPRLYLGIGHDVGHVVLPRDDDVLREELAFSKYDVGSMPLKLIPKEKLPRSPNRADALAMVFRDLPDPRELKAETDESLAMSPTRFARDTEQYAASTFDD